jgi:hypothetical protein
MKKIMTLAPGAVIEPVGDDVMVMVPGNTDIRRISGPAADTLRTIAAGQPVDPSAPTVRELANQGIIQTPGMSRRGLIRAGAIGAGAGIAVLAMPSVAAAASVGGGGATILGTWRRVTGAGPTYPEGTTPETVDNVTPLTVLFFIVDGVDFPDELGEGSFSPRATFYPAAGPGATPPGPLVGLPTEFSTPLGTVWYSDPPAGPGEVTETNTDAVRTYSALDAVNGNSIVWGFRSSSVPTGDLTASFVWGNNDVPYQVTFQAPPPA